MIRIRLAVPGVLLLLTLGTAASCCCRRWSRADELAAGLRCGMTRQEVKQYAGSYRDLYINDHPGGTNLPHMVLVHSGTYINLWFDDDALRRVQVTWVSAPMKLSEDVPRDLCAPK